jgi:DNA polymerase III alpha subunit
MLGDETKLDEVKQALGRGPNVKRREKIREIVAAFEAADHQDTMPQILLWEKEYLGTTISGSPADLNRAMKARNQCIEIGRGDIMPDQNVELCVVVEAMREHIIKKGKNAGNAMAFLTVSDSSYRMDNVTVFTREYMRIKGQIEPGDVAAIEGRMTDRGLVANKIRRL